RGEPEVAHGRRVKWMPNAESLPRNAERPLHGRACGAEVAAIALRALQTQEDADVVERRRVRRFAVKLDRFGEQPLTRCMILGVGAVREVAERARRERTRRPIELSFELERPLIVGLRRGEVADRLKKEAAIVEERGVDRMILAELRLHEPAAFVIETLGIEI